MEERHSLSRKVIVVLVVGDGHCNDNWRLVRDVWKVKWTEKNGLVFVGHTLELKPPIGCHVGGFTYRRVLYSSLGRSI